MKKLLVLAIIAVSIVIVAYFMLFRINSADISAPIESAGEDVTGQEEVSEAFDEVLVGKSTLSSLSLLGKDLECTFLYKQDDSVASSGVEGTYFVSGDDIRVDMLTESPDLNGQILTSMITNDSMVYIWSEIEGDTYGLKMSLEKFKSSEDSENSSLSQPISMDSEVVSYDCKSWSSVDRTVFLPPSDVLFQDYSALMQAGMEEAVLYEEGSLLKENVFPQ